MIHDDDDIQHVTIALELPGGLGTNSIVLQTVLDVLDHLERDGLHPYRTAVEISEQPPT